jgi:GTP-binding protein HflX
MVFNKMDLYEANTFDKWLEEDIKKDILQSLKQHWDTKTNGNTVFIAALEKRNVEELRKTIMEKVAQLYRERYPYKTEFFY